MLNHEAIKRNVDITIGLNGRDGHYSLHRQHKAEQKINLALLNGKRGVKFAHKNGFYAVLHTELTDREILELLDQAMPSNAK